MRQDHLDPVRHERVKGVQGAAVHRRHGVAIGRFKLCRRCPIGWTRMTKNHEGVKKVPTGFKERAVYLSRVCVTDLPRSSPVPAGVS